MLNLIAVSCRTISLGHALINNAFGAAILIAHDDPEGGDEDGRGGMRSAAKPGSYYTAKKTPLIKTLAPRALQQPLMPVTLVKSKRIDHRSPFMQQGRRPWSIEEARGV